MTKQQLDALIQSRLASFAEEFLLRVAIYGANEHWQIWLTRRQHHTGTLEYRERVFVSWDEYTEYNISDAYTTGDVMGQYVERGACQVEPAANGLTIQTPTGAEFVPDNEIFGLYLALIHNSSLAYPNRDFVLRGDIRGGVTPLNKNEYPV